MARNSGNRPVDGPELTVGVRVLVRRSSGADLTGEVVEDYAAVTDPGGGGHEWAPVHRWAVALDDGRLVFADTEDLTIDSGFHRSAPDLNLDQDSGVRAPGRHRGSDRRRPLRGRFWAASNIVHTNCASSQSIT